MFAILLLATLAHSGPINSNGRYIQLDHFNAICNLRSKLCLDETMMLCAARRVENKWAYRSFNGSCDLFITNMCDYPGQEYHVVMGGSCDPEDIARVMTPQRPARRVLQRRQRRRRTTTTTTTSTQTTPESMNITTNIPLHVRPLATTKRIENGTNDALRQQKKTTKKAQPTKKKAPNTTKKAPQTTKKAPNTKKKAPQTTKKAPQTTKKAPNTTKKAPQTTKKAPNTTKKAPQTTKKAPQTTKKAPNTTKPPNTTKKPPNPTTKAVVTTTTPKKSDPVTTKPTAAPASKPASAADDEYYSDEEETTTPAPVRVTYGVEWAYDGHDCPYHCPDTYSPECINVNRGFGKYFKMYTFLNHCLADMYYCKHWEEFQPPKEFDYLGEMVRSSPISWSYCANSRYIQFARFSEMASSMGHYGWLHGDHRYSKILEPWERPRPPKC